MERVNHAMLKAYCAAMTAVQKLEERAKKITTEECGAADFIAVIIIIAIVVALCVVFRGKIKSLFDTIWGTIEGSTTSATAGY